MTTTTYAADRSALLIVHPYNGRQRVSFISDEVQVVPALLHL